MVAGRKPKPTELKRLEGNPGCRPLNENEPKPRPIRPDCPEWLTDDAKLIWDKAVPILERTGILTEADGDVLAQYSTAFSNWKQLEIKMRGLPLVMVVGKGGYMQQAPLVSACMKASMLVSRLGELLGLNPSSRSRIMVPPGGEDDAEEFLFGKTKG
jgi:P27 family predicted phage terminase small subunit